MHNVLYFVNYSKVMVRKTRDSVIHHCIVHNVLFTLLFIALFASLPLLCLM